MGRTPQSATGLYGKLPARGDFVTLNLPRAFVEPWDGWVQAGMVASRAALGVDWLDCYLTAPVWKFALAPSVCGPVGMAGLMIPSVDAVGRYFPLVVATEVPDRPPAEIATGGGTWYRDGEDCALACLDPALDLASLAERLGAMVWNPETMPAGDDAVPISVRETHGATWYTLNVAGAGNTLATMPAAIPEQAGGLRVPADHRSLWWTRGSDKVAPSVVVVPGSLSPTLFTSFLCADSNDGAVDDGAGWEADGLGSTSPEAEPPAQHHRHRRSGRRSMGA